MNIDEYNGFMNEIEPDDIINSIKEYEKRGLLENETWVLLVDDNKFHFRCKHTGVKLCIDYVLYEDNYDSSYSEEEIFNLNLCLEESIIRGFELEY